MSRPGAAGSARTLPCGRNVADLVELIADGALHAGGSDRAGSASTSSAPAGSERGSPDRGSAGGALQSAGSGADSSVSGDANPGGSRLDGSGSSGLARHARDCPYCSAELVVVRTDWDHVRKAAARQVDTPVGLVDRVQRSIRGLRGGVLADPIELTEPGGRLSVAEPVLVVIVRQLVREHSAARGGLWERGVELDDGRLLVRIAVDYGTDIGATADDLRQHLGAGLVEHVGAAVPVIEVEVVDVVAPHPFG